MNRKKSYFLVIDVSTTACKVFIFDSYGNMIAEAYRSMPLFYPKPDWVEVDANDWWNLTIECIHEVLNCYPSLKIDCVGVCGLMHALVPVDSLGKPLDKVMLWMDQRCKPQCEWIQNNINSSSGFVTRTMPTYYSAPKLKWLVENKPDIVDKTYKFMFGKDYIRMKLTDEYATDESDAGGSALFDGKNKCWSSKMLDLIGISTSKMLPIRDSMEIAGYVTKKASEETGIPSKTPVIVGAADVRSTLIGVNIYVPGRTCLYMGTAGWMATTDENGSVNWVGSTATLGIGLKWCKDMFGESMDYLEMFRLAQEVPPGSDGVIFFPHLMGERWPKYNPYAKGTIFGLTISHQKKHIIRAILEGNAYIIRQMIDNFGYDRIINITATGGGAKSLLWLQIISDVTQKIVSVPKVTEATALGTVILSAVGMGIFNSLNEAMGKLVQIHDICFPQKGIYDKLYQLYTQIDNELEKFYEGTSL